MGSKGLCPHLLGANTPPIPSPLSGRSPWTYSCDLEHLPHGMKAVNACKVDRHMLKFTALSSDWAGDAPFPGSDRSLGGSSTSVPPPRTVISWGAVTAADTNYLSWKHLRAQTEGCHQSKEQRHWSRALQPGLGAGPRRVGQASSHAQQSPEPSTSHLWANSQDQAPSGEQCTTHHPAPKPIHHHVPTVLPPK